MKQRPIAEALQMNQVTSYIGGIDLVSLLREEITQTESSLQLLELLKQYGNEQVEFDETPQNICARVLKLLEIFPQDTVYDLGSGYGGFCILGSILYPAKFVGIELVRERHAAAERIRQQLGTNNAIFLNCNVRSVNISDGSKFFLSSPFLEHTFEYVIDGLRSASEKRPIRVVAMFHAASVLSRQSWLKECLLESQLPASIFDIGMHLFVGSKVV